MSDMLLLLPEVCQAARLSSASIYRLEGLGRFPRRIKIGIKRVAWRKDEIEAWLAQRSAERNAQA